MQQSRGGSGRDLFGKDIVEHEERLNVPRLKRERLIRLQAEIANADLGGLLLHDPVNIRYATGAHYPGVYFHRFYARYALIPREGRPIRFGGVPDVPDEVSEVRKSIARDFFSCGRYVDEATRLWAADLAAAIKERGVAAERLGVDRLDITAQEALLAERIKLADGRVPVEKAQAIKTTDELILIRQACAVADVAISEVKDAIRPGVTENEMFAILTATNIRFGGDHMDARLLTAGGNTKPWGRFATDRIVRPGDLVAFDTDMAGRMGYMADVSRTYLCGDTRPTAEQREAYSVAYDFLQAAIPCFRSGKSFEAVAEQVPAYPEEYREQRYMGGLLAHGVGMSDGWPSIYFADINPAGFANDPNVLEDGMVICIEALATKPSSRECVKLEEQVIITASGPEVISFAPHDRGLSE